MSNNLFHRAQRAMQERRDVNKESIRQALDGTGPKTAGLMFDLSQGEKGTTLDDTRRSHVKAIELVSSLLSSFSLPVRPQLEYHGMIKNATDNNGNISDGIIRVGAILHTLMGHKAHIEIPVIIRGRNLIEPALFFYDDAPYVMCGPAVDELIKRGSLERSTQSRYIYSPPEDKMSIDDKPREGITNYEHMFAPGARNPYNFRRQYSKPAQHKGEPRKRTNIDTPTEFPELWVGDVEDEMLDPAERCRKKLFGIGSGVTLTEDAQARERGGGVIIVPKGEHGKIVKDIEGDGKVLYVNFPAMNLTTALPKRIFRSAAFRLITAQTQPEYLETQPAYVEETYMVDLGGEFAVGASASLDVPDDYEEGETNHLSGMAYYYMGSWQPWGKDVGSEAIASKLNEETWVASIIADAFPISDEVVLWNKSGTKIAVTSNQVNNEVKAMLREGYSQVDIKDAIKRRYPEQADEALEPFDKSAGTGTLVPVVITVTYPQEMDQEEAFNQVKAMISKTGQLTDSEVGLVKATSEPVPEQDHIFLTAEIELDSTFVNGMTVGNYIEEQQGDVGFSLEAPGF